MEKENIKTDARSKDMQDSINHLILGITMWVSASITCITTLLTVKQSWCLVTLLLPFIYTMFPQIHKLINSIIESSYNRVKTQKVSKKDKEHVTIEFPETVNQ